MSNSYNFSRAVIKLLGLCSLTIPEANIWIYFSQSVCGMGVVACSTFGESSRVVTWQDSNIRRARRRLRLEERAMLIANSSGRVMFSLRETVLRTAETYGKINGLEMRVNMLHTFALDVNYNYQYPCLSSELTSS